MRLQKIIIFLGILFTFVIVDECFGETPFQVKVISQEEIKPFIVEHMSLKMDRKVIFRFINTTNKPIKIYGSLVEQELQPIRYLLKFDEKLKQWRYPTLNGEPIPWEKVSATYKKFRNIRHGEYVDFSSYFSSIEDCNKKFKVSIQIGVGKSTNLEVMSEEFTIEKCKTEDKKY